MLPLLSIFCLLCSGVPRLQRLELETACEDFSNIIGSLSDGIVYKGTLSSGVEIAVTSTAVKSPEDWSKKSEEQFRNKVPNLQIAQIFCGFCSKAISHSYIFFSFPDRHAIKSEPQELCEPYWVLWRRRAFHKDDGFWVRSKRDAFWAFTQWVQ